MLWIIVIKNLCLSIQDTYLPIIFYYPGMNKGKILTFTPASAGLILEAVCYNHVGLTEEFFLNIHYSKLIKNPE